jgi:hypothetical protein
MTNPPTTPEAVERLAQDMQQHMPFGRGAATLRALSAALEAERASHTATLKDAQDECARAEAAEAEVARLREVLEFYGEKSAWNQPPVRTNANGLLGVAYESRSSEMQRDRGAKARAALSAIRNND